MGRLSFQTGIAPSYGRIVLEYVRKECWDWPRHACLHAHAYVKAESAAAIKVVTLYIRYLYSL